MERKFPELSINCTIFKIDKDNIIRPCQPFSTPIGTVIDVNGGFVKEMKCFNIIHINVFLK